MREINTEDSASGGSDDVDLLSRLETGVQSLDALVDHGLVLHEWSTQCSSDSSLTRSKVHDVDGELLDAVLDALASPQSVSDQLSPEVERALLTFVSGSRPVGVAMRQLSFLGEAVSQSLGPQGLAVQLLLIQRTRIVIGLCLTLAATQGLQKLNQVATRDGLTGLLNRATFNQDLTFRISVARSDVAVLAFVFIDLDGLKTVNDEFGHDAGDELICKLSQVLAEGAARVGGFAYRWGGDEYALLLPGSSQTDTETLMSAVEQTAPLFSWGSSMFPADADNEKELVELADKRMYAMKDGRKKGMTDAS